MGGETCARHADCRLRRRLGPTRVLHATRLSSDPGAVPSSLGELDRAPAQVVIQALLVEVQLDSVDEFGVELGFQDSVLFNRSVIDNILTITETVSNPGTGVQTTNQSRNTV